MSTEMTLVFSEWVPQGKILYKLWFSWLPKIVHFGPQFFILNPRYATLAFLFLLLMTLMWKFLGKTMFKEKFLPRDLPRLWRKCQKELSLTVTVDYMYTEGFCMTQ